MSTALEAALLKKENESLRDQLAEARKATIEECALVALSFGEFPGRQAIKEMRVMCGNAIAEKIRELALSGEEGKS
jgi:hypothetical protein